MFERMDFLVLGPVEVLEGGIPIAIGGPKQRAVLATLIAEVGTVVSLDRTVAEVYGADADPRSRRSVQTFISMFR